MAGLEDTIEISRRLFLVGASGLLVSELASPRFTLAMGQELTPKQLRRVAASVKAQHYIPPKETVQLSGEQDLAFLLEVNERKARALSYLSSFENKSLSPGDRGHIRGHMQQIMASSDLDTDLERSIALGSYNMAEHSLNVFQNTFSLESWEYVREVLGEEFGEKLLTAGAMMSALGRFGRLAPHPLAKAVGTAFDIGGAGLVLFGGLFKISDEISSARLEEVEGYIEIGAHTAFHQMDEGTNEYLAGATEEDVRLIQRGLGINIKGSASEQGLSEKDREYLNLVLDAHNQEIETKIERLKDQLIAGIQSSHEQQLGAFREVLDESLKEHYKDVKRAELKQALDRRREKIQDLRKRRDLDGGMQLFTYVVGLSNPEAARNISAIYAAHNTLSWIVEQASIGALGPLGIIGKGVGIIDGLTRIIAGGPSELEIAFKQLNQTLSVYEERDQARHAQSVRNQEAMMRQLGSIARGLYRHREESRRHYDELRGQVANAYDYNRSQDVANELGALKVLLENLRTQQDRGPDRRDYEKVADALVGIKNYAIIAASKPNFTSSHVSTGDKAQRTDEAEAMEQIDSQIGLLREILADTGDKNTYDVRNPIEWAAATNLFLNALMSFPEVTEVMSEVELRRHARELREAGEGIQTIVQAALTADVAGVFERAYGLVADFLDEKIEDFFRSKGIENRDLLRVSIVDKVKIDRNTPFEFGRYSRFHELPESSFDVWENSSFGPHPRYYGVIPGRLDGRGFSLLQEARDLGLIELIQVDAVDFDKSDQHPKRGGGAFHARITPPHYPHRLGFLPGIDWRSRRTVYHIKFNEGSEGAIRGNTFGTARPGRFVEGWVEVMFESGGEKKYLSYVALEKPQPFGRYEIAKSMDLLEMIDNELFLYKHKLRRDLREYLVAGIKHDGSPGIIEGFEAAGRSLLYVIGINAWTQGVDLSTSTWIAQNPVPLPKATAINDIITPEEFEQMESFVRDEDAKDMVTPQGVSHQYTLSRRYAQFPRLLTGSRATLADAVRRILSYGEQVRKVEEGSLLGEEIQEDAIEKVVQLAKEGKKITLDMFNPSVTGTPRQYLQHYLRREVLGQVASFRSQLAANPSKRLPFVDKTLDMIAAYEKKLDLGV